MDGQRVRDDELQQPGRPERQQEEDAEADEQRERDRRPLDRLAKGGLRGRLNGARSSFALAGFEILGLVGLLGDL
ncbi:hypothetical protein D3C83_161730 [compost metagenome]